MHAFSAIGEIPSSTAVASQQRGAEACLTGAVFWYEVLFGVLVVAVGPPQRASHAYAGACLLCSFEKPPRQVMGANGNEIVVEFDCGSQQFADCAAAIIKVSGTGVRLRCVVVYTQGSPGNVFFAECFPPLSDPCSSLAGYSSVNYNSNCSARAYTEYFLTKRLKARAKTHETLIQPHPFLSMQVEFDPAVAVSVDNPDGSKHHHLLT